MIEREYRPTDAFLAFNSLQAVMEAHGIYVKDARALRRFEDFPQAVRCSPRTAKYWSRRAVLAWIKNLELKAIAAASSGDAEGPLILTSSSDDDDRPDEPVARRRWV